MYTIVYMQSQEPLKLGGAYVWKVQLLRGPVQRKVGGGCCSCQAALTILLVNTITHL